MEEQKEKREGSLANHAPDSLAGPLHIIRFLNKAIWVQLQKVGRSSMIIDLDIPKLCRVLLPCEFRIRFPGVCECVVCTDINRFYNCTNVRGFKKFRIRLVFHWTSS